MEEAYTTQEGRFSRNSFPLFPSSHPSPRVLRPSNGILESNNYKPDMVQDGRRINVTLETARMNGTEPFRKRGGYVSPCKPNFGKGLSSSRWKSSRTSTTSGLLAAQHPFCAGQRLSNIAALQLRNDELLLLFSRRPRI